MAAQRPFAKCNKGLPRDQRAQLLQYGSPDLAHQSDRKNEAFFG